MDINKENVQSISVFDKSHNLILIFQNGEWLVHSDYKLQIIGNGDKFKIGDIELSLPKVFSVDFNSE